MNNGTLESNNESLNCFIKRERSQIQSISGLRKVYLLPKYLSSRISILIMFPAREHKRELRDREVVNLLDEIKTAEFAQFPESLMPGSDRKAPCEMTRNMSDLYEQSSLTPLQLQERTSGSETVESSIQDDNDRDVGDIFNVIRHTDSETSHVVVRTEAKNDECDVKLRWCGLHVGTLSVYIGEDSSFETFRVNLTESLANKSLRTTSDAFRFVNGQAKRASTMAMSSHGLLVTPDNWHEFRFSPVRLVSYTYFLKLLADMKDFRDECHVYEKMAFVDTDLFSDPGPCCSCSFEGMLSPSVNPVLSS